MRIGLVTLFVCLGAFQTALSYSDPLKESQELRARGDYKQAEAVLREALNDGKADAERRAMTLNSLGDLLREVDRGTESRGYFESALAVRGPGWQARYSALLGLADLDRQREAWTESIDEWNQAIAIAVGNGSAACESFAIRGLGETWLDRGEYSRAEPLLKRAVAMIENNGSVPAYRVGVSLDSLASLYRIENKTSIAEELWSRELQINRKTFGDYHPQTALTMGHLAEAWAADGEYDRAREYAHEATGIMKQHFDANSPAVASALINEGMVEQRAKRLEASAGLYGQALEILRASGDRADRARRAVAKLYANVLTELHRGREAKQVIASISSFHAK